MAFVWDCDDCGSQNFVRSVILEPGSVDVDELPESEEIREWIEAGNEGQFCTAPDVVVCQFCGSVFDTEDQR